MVQEYTSEKMIALEVRAVRLSVNELRETMKRFLASQNNRGQRIYKGKQSFRHLVEGNGNGQLTNIEITDQNIKAFNRTAHKFGIDYALRKDSSVRPPKYLVFFKAKDNEVMTARIIKYVLTINGEIIITTFDHMFFVNEKGFELALLQLLKKNQHMY